MVIYQDLSAQIVPKIELEKLDSKEKESWVGDENEEVIEEMIEQNYGVVLFDIKVQADVTTIN